MKRLITRDDQIPVSIRSDRSPNAGRVSVLEPDEWIEVFSDGAAYESFHGSHHRYYSTAAGWIQTDTVTMLDCPLDQLPARITQHHRGTPDPSRGTPTMPEPDVDAVMEDPRDKESPRLETPPTTYPKYVMVNGGWGEPCKLLRHHAHPDHAGEYVNHATGEYTRIRQLLEDLNNE